MLYPHDFSNQTKVQWPSLVTLMGFQKIKIWSFLSQTRRWSVITDDSPFSHYTCTYSTTLLACMIYLHLTRLSFVRIFSQSAVQPKKEICQGAKHSIFSSKGMSNHMDLLKQYIMNGHLTLHSSSTTSSFYQCPSLEGILDSGALRKAVISSNSQSLKSRGNFTPQLLLAPTEWLTNMEPTDASLSKEHSYKAGSISLTVDHHTICHEKNWIHLSLKTTKWIYSNTMNQISID